MFRIIFLFLKFDVAADTFLLWTMTQISIPVPILELELELSPNSNSNIDQLTLTLDTVIYIIHQNFIILYVIESLFIVLLSTTMCVEMSWHLGINDILTQIFFVDKSYSVYTNYTCLMTAHIEMSWHLELNDISTHKIPCRQEL